jgi:hypothetical protein
MQFTWEPSDIQCGRVVCRTIHGEEEHGFKAHGNAVKWTAKIGFIAGQTAPKHYCTIAVGCDGMVCGPYTAEELVQRFNTEGIRPMPHDWYLKVIEESRKQQEGW